MKKICFVTTISLTLKMFVKKTAEYIHDNTDWDISFICSNDDEFAASLPEYIHYYPIPMERGISLSGIKAMLEMRKIFKREKFDLVQYSTPNASLYAALASKLAGIPRRLYCQWGLAYVGFSGLKRKIFKAEEKLVCALSTWIEPDSKSNLDFSHKERLYPLNKGSVIWNGSACGVNLVKFNCSKREEYRKVIRERLNITEDSFIIGFVGRITRDKGINELYEAFKEVQSNHEKCYLLMVGPSEVDQSVNVDLAEWAEKSEHVMFTGFTNEVEKYLAAMDVYVLPSYREGFGMGVVEAEAMATPVIITDIPGPVDAMENDKTGLVVKKKDVKTLKEAIEKMLMQKDLRVHFAEEAVKYAEDRFEQQILFGKILEDRKRLLNE